jgi:hypothetical protein
VDTEPALVDLVLDLAGWDGTGLLLEPAAGRGAFLVRAFERAVARGVAPTLAGIELHPFAVRVARLRLALAAARAGVAHARIPAVHLGDALEDDPRWPEGGFDLVVGNPPYVRGERLPAARRAELRARWPDLGAGNVDLVAYFVRRALAWTRPGGRLALVLPQGVSDQRACQGLRARLAGLTIEALVGLEWAPPQFRDATVIPCVLVVRNAPPPARHAVRLAGARAAATSDALAIDEAPVPQRSWLAVGRGRWPLEVRPGDLPLLEVLDRAPRPLVAGYGIAVRTRARAGALIARQDAPAARAFARPRPLLDGREVRPWALDWGGRVIDWRPDLLSEAKSEAFFRAPKVVVARIALAPQAAVDEGDGPGGAFFARNTVMVVRAPGTALDEEPHALAAVVNSLACRAYALLVLRAGVLAGSHRATLYALVLGDLPVPAPLLEDRARATALAALGRRARDHARAGDAAALRRVEAEVDDVVARAYGLDAAARAALAARAAAPPLARLLRPPRAGTRVRSIAVKDWAAGARYR